MPWPTTAGPWGFHRPEPRLPSHGGLRWPEEPAPQWAAGPPWWPPPARGDRRAVVLTPGGLHWARAYLPGPGALHWARGARHGCPGGLHRPEFRLPGLPCSLGGPRRRASRGACWGAVSPGRVVSIQAGWTRPHRRGPRGARWASLMPACQPARRGLHSCPSHGCVLCWSVLHT